MYIAVCTEGNHENGANPDGSDCPAHGIDFFYYCWEAGGGFADLGDSYVPPAEGSPDMGSGGGGSGAGPGAVSPPPNNCSHCNEVITMPVIDLPSPGPILGPCTKLTQKTNETIYKNRLVLLRTNSNYALNKEKGFIEVKPQSNGTKYVDLITNPFTHSIALPPQIDILGITHTHNNDHIGANGKPVKTIKIFSVEDIINLLVRCRIGSSNLNLTYEDAYEVMASSVGTFAIKMLVPMTSAEVHALTDWDEFTKQYDRLSEELVENNSHNDPVKLQKMLMGLLKKNKLSDKVGLYKATNNDATQWSRVTFENNVLAETPCN